MMILKKGVALSLLFCSITFAKGTDFDVNRMVLPDALSVFWSEVLHKPYMIAPDLVQDGRLVTLHISPENDERSFILRYLSNMNIKVSEKNGVDYIYSYIPQAPREKLSTFTYTPKFRTVEYLSSALSSAFTQVDNTSTQSSNTENPTANRAVRSPQRFMSRQGDRLLFRGSASEIAELQVLLPEIDIRAEQVDVTAYVFEVSTDERNGSGLQLAAKLLNSHFTISTGARQGYGNFIQFSTGSLDALYELFRTDNHFSLVSSPSLRVASGEQSSFSVGASVPTLGAVTYQDGTPVQSVEYRNTGIQFNVKPVITEGLISITMSQQLSDYAQTTTGVNNTPTFTNRQIMTHINMKDGDIVVLSGLAENKDNTTNTGFSFLPKSWSTESNQKMNTDLLIVLQAKKVKD